LRTQIAGYLYGVTPEDNEFVREIRCIVLVPQIGNHQSVTLPQKLPESDVLGELQPLGWIHTQPNELIQNGMQILPAPDVVMHCSITAENPRQWKGDDEIVITTSFTQGSCSLTAYKITDVGHEWGKKNKNVTGGVTNAGDYTSDCFEKVQMLLSDRFKGFFMVPDGGLGWNYNFQGVKHTVSMDYQLRMDVPEPFYAECHRPQHFLTFAQIEEAGDEGADLDDLLS
jgi:pre-mRNA-processing factor 8